MDRFGEKAVYGPCMLVGVSTQCFSGSFGEKAVYGPCTLVGASTQCFSGSLWREGSLRALYVGGSIDTMF